ncbi:MAG TPA: FkbM family methyltransferase [Puia sp.]
MNNILNKIYRRIANQTGIAASLVNGRRSYSQCGEDLLVNYVFDMRGVKYPSYLDIGANHPFFISNTAFFYRKGCRGINVEANPHLISSFRRLRKKDTTLNVGVGPVEGEMNFYIISDPTLSTFSKEEADHIVATGKYSIRSVEKIKLITVEQIVNEYFKGKFPDFLSIDVEGLDLVILQSIRFDLYWPKVICVEAAEYSPIGTGARRSDIIDFLVSKGYYEYANTNLNAIMIKKDFWFI